MSNQSLEKISHVPYGLRSLLKWFVPIIAIPLFVYGFLSLFPIEKRITSLLKSNLSSNSECPIDFESFKTKLFFPGAILQNVKIPSFCLDSQKDLNLRQVELTWRGISFNPIGLAFKANLNVFNAPLEANIVAGLGTQQININNQEVRLEDLSDYLPIEFKLQGKVMINTLAHLKDQSLDRIVLQLNSKTLDFPPQAIRFPNFPLPFNLPRIYAQNLNIHAQLIDDILDIKEFTLGSNQSPLRVKINKGSIKINKNNSDLSRLNLQTELYLDPKDQTLSSIGTTLLGQFDKKDDFYQINISGTTGSPRLK